jgi:hypothetical protein
MKVDVKIAHVISRAIKQRNLQALQCADHIGDLGSKHGQGKSRGSVVNCQRK